jgi:hypothetical protein
MNPAQGGHRPEKKPFRAFRRVSAEERRIRRTAEIFGFLPALIHGRIPAAAGPHGSERMPFRLGFETLEIMTQSLRYEGWGEGGERCEKN